MPTYGHASGVLVLDDATYLAFPGVTRIGDDSLVAVARQGSSHLAGGDLVTLTANAAGTAWSGLSDLIDTAKDIRDAEIATLSDGRTVITYTERTAGDDDFVPRAIFSDAPGAPVTIAHGFTGWAFVTGKIIEDDDGYLYVPLYGVDAGGVSGEDDYCRVSRSTTPGGATFAAHAVVVASGVGGRAWSEPNIAPLSTPGHYVCALRADVGAPQTYTATSTDGMATWAAPVLAVEGGGRPSIHRTPEGALLLAHRDTAGRGEVRWSFDDAESWGWSVSLGILRPYVYGSWVTLASGDVGLLWAYEEHLDNDQDANLRFDVFTYVEV